MVFVWIITIIFIITMMVMLIRFIKFRPNTQLNITKKVIKIDEKRATESLQTMLRFKTVSYENKTLEDVEAFEGFRTYLKTRYPTIEKHSKIEEIDETGMLFTLKGKSNQAPIVLMSHYDVVPPNGTWAHDPFGAEIVNNRIVGRGAIDTKSTLCAVMESVEHFLKEGNSLNHDLLLAFSGDEETRGPSAPAIVDHLEQQNITPQFVLDEGGAILEDIFPGVHKPSALIGIAEKGYMNVSLTVNTEGGHASMPPQTMAIPTLSKAVNQLHKGQLFKIKKVPATMAMFDRLSRHSSSNVIRLVFANTWLFFPLIKWRVRHNREVQSLLKTTQSFTMMEGAQAMNVLPNTARIGVNYRISTEESVDFVKQQIVKRINDSMVDVHIDKSAEPTTNSLIDDTFEVLETSIREIWGDVVTTPYLMMAGTDSRYHHNISSHVYRFSPMQMSANERQSIHSINESIDINNYLNSIRFYVNLLHKLQG